MTLSDIKKFYNKYYFPQNTSIVVISSREFEKVKYIINKYFGQWKVKLDKNDGSNKLNCKKIEYEYPKVEVLNNKRNGIKTCRVEIICPIDNLTSIEMKSLRIFNQYFGEGVNSLLYDILRTENGLIYDVITKIANEII